MVAKGRQVLERSDNLTQAHALLPLDYFLDDLLDILLLLEQNQVAKE